MTSPSDPGLPSYPGGDEPAPRPTAPPRPVVIAFWALLACAAYTLLTAVLLFADYDNQVTQIVADRRPGTSIADATTIARQILTSSLIIGVVLSAIYIGGAFMFRAGKNWARITVTVVVVIFGIFTLLGGAIDVRALAVVLIEIVAVALLYVPTAREYFTGSRERIRRRFL